MPKARIAAFKIIPDSDIVGMVAHIHRLCPQEQRAERPAEPAPGARAYRSARVQPQMGDLV
jgi:hypothetical protein